MEPRRDPGRRGGGDGPPSPPPPSRLAQERGPRGGRSTHLDRRTGAAATAEAEASGPEAAERPSLIAPPPPPLPRSWSGRALSAAAAAEDAVALPTPSWPKRRKLSACQEKKWGGREKKWGESRGENITNASSESPEEDKKDLG